MAFENFSNINSYYLTKPLSVNQKPKAKRYRAYEHTIKTMDKIQAGIGATIGTVIPLILMMRRQKIKNPFKLKYGLKDMVLMSGAAVVGGVAVGMIGDSKRARKNKLKEGIFQFMNATIPTWLVSGVLKLSENSKTFGKFPIKIASVFLALIVGMFGTATVSNLICDPKDKEPDRKLTMKDCLVNIDDALGALVLARIPFIDKLHVEGILPVIYGYCGYRAGKSN